MGKDLATTVAVFVGYEVANYAQQNIEADQGTMLQWMRYMTIFVTYLFARVTMPKFFQD